MNTLRLFVKRHIFDLFTKGKDLEVRTESNLTGDLRAGDLIVFNNSLTFEVVDIRNYPDFEGMLEVEDPNRIAPGYTNEIILEELYRIYRDRRRGRVLVFELKRPERRRRFLYAH